MVVGDFAIEVDTVVIGAGPGGYVAAIRAAQLGQKVVLVEKDTVGGVCLNVGCIPSKALIASSHRYQDAKNSEDMGVKVKDVKLDFSKVQEFKGKVVDQLVGGVESLLKGNKVEVVKGEAYFSGKNSIKVATENQSQTYEFKHAIVATGSRPIEIPGFAFGDRVLDSTGALNLEKLPKKLVVIGGGYIGTELGTAYANLGTEVTILEGMKDILGGFERNMTSLVKRNLKKKDVKVVTEAMAKSAEETKDGVKVTYEDKKGNTETIEADYVLVTVGRRPNTDELGLEGIGVKLTDRGLVEVDKQGRSSVDSIFAIGDIVPGLPLAHKASYEAKVAAEAIAGEKSEVDYIGMPAVCFTEPELASVGINETEAKEEGLDIVTGRFPFAANGRAIGLNKTDGFVKLVARKEDGLVIGAQVAGDGASDIISELALAVETGMTLEDVALTIHPHPTLGEMPMEAAEAALGRPIHSL
ncbi:MULTISPECIES: dihydrolipoyl dehydrogenase [Nosocomiicoccus]|uniref:Dihydrolipoyl dehydrogenase n=1 Tax=Nosocomiicoccus massiliensis TaxID=1232430 RepID=A0AAF0YIB7_9STAP|nr:MULTISPECIES: dihydrolipoyl dehydrogenase [Nosocomiicoccus]MDK6863391.1 dihydrolipoyl dehydrogenase [Nosocomiicoccus ampullae]OFL49306.1 dihydrolipoyl dehydrogenase [Nosocomiicoccus sp. HMSC067E10]OFO51252.1 dihydrolipoyl dehydrogenase [Nosocomiicoccus sp. HMSC059G07]OFS62495.1 dihydrolipoyl dehydrogenase [Nosocomiicoccus sp. HMSC09A07]WOS96168.1 dihydrolipoyl dehydrogenase [Nosocomiicoccus massiliensis]